MSLLLLFRPRAGGGDTPPPPVQVEQTQAGRKQRRKYLVEIDGQEFLVGSVEEALSLLNKAAELAETIAKRDIEQTVQKALPKARRLGKVDPVQPKLLEITGSLPLYKELVATKNRIERIYRDAAITAELRLYMALQAEQDDEDVLLLSL